MRIKITEDKVERQKVFLVKQFGIKGKKKFRYEMFCFYYHIDTVHTTCFLTCKGKPSAGFHKRRP
jgi:hypothetical protein